MQDWLLPFAILAGILGMTYYSLYSHFTQLFTAQADVTDKILSYFNNIKGEPEVSEIDVGRTHILGGFVHGAAICADGCWCKEEE